MTSEKQAQAHSRFDFDTNRNRAAVCVRAASCAVVKPNTLLRNGNGRHARDYVNINVNVNLTPPFSSSFNTLRSGSSSSGLPASVSSSGSSNCTLSRRSSNRAALARSAIMRPLETNVLKSDCDYSDCRCGCGCGRAASACSQLQSQTQSQLGRLQDEPRLTSMRALNSGSGFGSASTSNRGSSISTSSSSRNSGEDPFSASTSVSYSYPQSPISESSSDVDSMQLINVRIRPDSLGRFGLSVTGGIDEQTPVIVSRIARGMPADCAVPRLNEGDQLVTICEQDASRLSHAEVVSLIRSRGQTRTELTLTVRPSLFYLSLARPSRVAGEESLNNDEKWRKLQQQQQQSDFDFDLSVAYLREVLQTRAVLEQFERVPLSKRKFSTDAASSSRNLNKNRYCDVLPYDQTRVLLTTDSAFDSDYVNASHVDIEVSGTGIVTRYIAAQGPLASTADDFWTLVWQQQCTCIVMLTQCVEQGRAKCHRYWPNAGDSRNSERFSVTCVRERPFPSITSCSYCEREFIMTDLRSGDQRRVTQLQYLRWPDHSVPDNESHFVQFILRLREARIGQLAPTLVHCSAGIGRTGVLILVDTLVTLIESRRPLNVLYFVNLMRAQRALLVQTPEQFAFSCTVALTMYDRGFLRPLIDPDRNTCATSGSSSSSLQTRTLPRRILH